MSTSTIYTIGHSTKSFEEWSVFPNPVTDFVKVYGANESVYQLLDATGRIIMNGLVINERIDLPILPSGLFLLRVSNDELTRTFKLVKP